MRWSLRKELQDSLSKVVSEENFNAHDCPVDEVEDQLSSGRIEKEGFVVTSVSPLRLGGCIEGRTEIIAAAAPVNKPKVWDLFNQLAFISLLKKHGQFSRKVRQTFLQQR